MMMVVIFACVPVKMMSGFAALYPTYRPQFFCHENHE
jgi:hypothetical protein